MYLVGLHIYYSARISRRSWVYRENVYSEDALVRHAFETAPTLPVEAKCRLWAGLIGIPGVRQKIWQREQVKFISTVRNIKRLWCPIKKQNKSHTHCYSFRVSVTLKFKHKCSFRVSPEAEKKNLVCRQSSEYRSCFTLRNPRFEIATRKRVTLAVVFIFSLALPLNCWYSW